MANQFSNTPFAGKFGDEILFSTAWGISDLRTHFGAIFALTLAQLNALFSPRTWR
jgi:hypothetical protein